MYEPISDAPGAPVAYAAEHTEAAFLTGVVLDHVDATTAPWFVHAAYIRPHPPFVAPEPYASMYDPATVPEPVRAETHEAEGAVHPVLAGAVRIPGVRLGDDMDVLRQIRATYYGMMSEVDAQLGRLFDGLRARGVWDDTLVVLTSDHGEQLGDHWLTEKLGWFEQSYHIPCIVRDPDAHDTRGAVVADRFTENVDIMPTVLEWLDLPVPLQCDGRSLLPFVHGDPPASWRDGAFWEWEFRDPVGGWAERILGLTMDQCAISVLRDEHGKYVHFTGLAPLFYDLDADPHELVNRADDPTYAATVLGYAQRMLSLRMEHVDQTLTGLVVTPAGVLDGRR
jgi:arylsulfatase A-like enzyme